jgi:hypothetical protein
MNDCCLLLILIEIFCVWGSEFGFSRAKTNSNDFTTILLYLNFIHHLFINSIHFTLSITRRDNVENSRASHLQRVRARLHSAQLIHKRALNVVQLRISVLSTRHRALQLHVNQMREARRV